MRTTNLRKSKPYYDVELKLQQAHTIYQFKFRPTFPEDKNILWLGFFIKSSSVLKHNLYIRGLYGL